MNRSIKTVGRFALGWLWGFALTGTLTAQTPGLKSESKPVEYERDIQPIFAAHCYSCHGPENQESEYRLDIKHRALGEGDIGGKPIVPGSSRHSPLIEYVKRDAPGLVMPPADDKNPLSPKQVAMLQEWIDQGASWPENLAGQAVNDDPRKTISTDHWSFQPVVDHPLPPVKPNLNSHFPLRSGIDHFVSRQLELNQLRPSEAADRVSLIRRLYLDMHGLQPSPEQVTSFLNDPSDAAYERVVDAALASSHYGERWARHWLDVVRFGESTGYEVNRDRTNAFYYRDYVIDSLNQDKSYRDFVIEQLAGDVVGVDEATGFLVGGANDIVKSPDLNLTLMQREDELADYVNTTSTAFLGLTVGCARCHNHKFDPILQSDFYSLQAVFAGVEHGERPLLNRIEPKVRDSLAQSKSELTHLETRLDQLRAENPHEPSTLVDLPAVNAKQNTDTFEATIAKFVRFEIHRTNQFEPCLDELEIYSSIEKTNVALASLGCQTTSSGDYQNDPKHQLEHVNDGKVGNANSWISDTPGSGWVQIEFPEPTSIDRVVWGRERNGAYSDRLAIGYSIQVSMDGTVWTEVSSSDRRQPFLINGKEPDDAFVERLTGDQAIQARELLESIKEKHGKIATLNQSIPVGYVGKFKTPAPIHRLYRGDPMSPREEVSPDTLAVMGTLELEKDAAEQSRRLTLAKWIASDENPLAARVIVNRVWHYHFGRGLVATPSDFGKNGARPSHPQLLDWLTARFIENDWSLKWLHREILRSSTYRQSSRPRSEATAKDADCRWLWRFPPRRLEAEAIRDCVLQLTGKLNFKAGGPGFLLFKIDHENVHHYFPLEEFGPEQFRRMIYMTKIRQEQDEVFGVFDCPDGGQTIPTRNRSTTALQALNMLNSKFVIEQAGYLADRLRSESGSDPEDQIRLAYRLAFSRTPSSEELQQAVELIDQHDVEAFCRALLNANEFLFVR